MDSLISLLPCTNPYLDQYLPVGLWGEQPPPQGVPPEPEHVDNGGIPYRLNFLFLAIFAYL